MSETAIEKMVEWLEIEYQSEDEKDCCNCLLDIVDKARSLLAEEKTQELQSCQKVSPYKYYTNQEKPTAPASLVEKLKSTCDRYSIRDDDRLWVALIRGILSKYTPVPDTQDGLQGELQRMYNALVEIIDRMTGECSYLNPEAKGHYEGSIEVYKAWQRELQGLISHHSAQDGGA